MVAVVQLPDGPRSRRARHGAIAAAAGAAVRVALGEGGRRAAGAGVQEEAEAGSDDETASPDSKLLPFLIGIQVLRIQYLITITGVHCTHARGGVS
mmetsp:Transcript_33305/g.74885  ORF Transcript_33305/g.74885 Transcript_33305/m.74885 type:complete len:96 (-) Transcript_33305:28-315(-)